MSSPYSTPDHQGSNEYLSFVAADARQLQIITAAMALAVLVVTGVMLTLTGGELKLEPEMISFIGIGMAVIMAINHIVIPNVIANAALKKVNGETLRNAGIDEKFALVGPVFRQRHIAACAFLEGAAIVNLIFYMLTSFAGNLAAAAVLLILLILRFPTASRIEFWAQDKIRELELT